MKLKYLKKFESLFDEAPIIQDEFALPVSEFRVVFIERLNATDEFSTLNNIEQYLTIRKEGDAIRMDIDWSDDADGAEVTSEIVVKCDPADKLMTYWSNVEMNIEDEDDEEDDYYVNNTDEESLTDKEPDGTEELGTLDDLLQFLEEFIEEVSYESIMIRSGVSR